MLTLLLVWTVALGSLSILAAGMIFPELSRKNDLIWVGVGLFYALILWANTGNIGGGLLLGQTAGISLTVWLGWQTLTQRRELTSPDKKTPVPDWLQKIVDVVTPLWNQAYGLVAGQLGLDSATDGDSDANAENPLSGFKAKALDILDKLNAQPKDGTAVQTPAAEVEKDAAIEVSEDASSAPEAVAEEVIEAEDGVEAVEEIVEETVEETVDLQPSPAAESAPVEVSSPGMEESVEEIEGAITGGAEEAPDHESEASDESPVSEPIAPMAEEGSETVIETSDDVQSAVTDAAEDATPQQTQDAVEGSAEITESPDGDDNEGDDNVEAIAAEPSDPADQAIATHPADLVAEESPQEESNWPPDEPID